MTIFYILISVIALGLFNYLTAKHSDKKTLTKLQKYLILAPKDNPEASMHRISGYGGGWAEFSSGKKFSFCTDEYLFQADRVISDFAPFQIISREQA